MAKSQKNQTFVLKVNTGYLSKNNWHLTFKLREIRKQPQLVVSLGSSQVLRWMPELTGVPDADLKASQIKQYIKYLKKQYICVYVCFKNLSHHTKFSLLSR